jgi:ATP-dependent Clp protease ATP-binding subunit ClpA
MALWLGAFLTSGINLTDRARRILVLARFCAATSGNSEVSPKHLLCALAMGDRGTARMILEASGVYLERDQELLLTEPTDPDCVEGKKLYFDDECVSVFRRGQEFGALLGLRAYFGTEHILFGLASSQHLPEYRYLAQHGISGDNLKYTTVSVLRLKNV